jgi:hypothetical protein
MRYHSILHFITALFHEAKDKFDHHRQNGKSHREMSESTIER